MNTQKKNSGLSSVSKILSPAVAGPDKSMTGPPTTNGSPRNEGTKAFGGDNVGINFSLLPRRINRREKLFALIVGLGLVGWLMENVIYQPAVRLSSSWAAKIQLNKGRLTKNRRLIVEGPAIDREYAAYLPFFRQTQGDEATMSLLLSQIESTASRIPLPVLEIKPQKVKGQDFYNDFSINLTLEEEFNKVYRFLYDIQNAPFLFNVEELHLEKDPLRENFIRCTVTLNKRLLRNND